jgi:hypothetical protein
VEVLGDKVGDSHWRPESVSRVDLVAAAGLGRDSWRKAQE